VDSAQRRAMPVDDLVARRMLELEAAEALEDMRKAIEADNWERAQRLVDDAATRFGGHEWTAAILVTMRRLIGERDKWIAMKEASFSNRSMNQRLASRTEAMYCQEGEPAIPSFLRRKPEQGKGKGRPGV
jgi:Ca-activated chloride channel homolog